MKKYGVDHRSDGSVLVTYQDDTTKDGIGERWLKPACYQEILKSIMSSKATSGASMTRRDAVKKARDMYPSGPFAVIITTAMENAGLDPEDQDSRRKMCGLFREIEEFEKWGDK